jgi:hypothetical protein
MGGTLANAASKWPDTLGKIELLRMHPYFLPCAVAASVAFTSFVFAFVGLREVCTPSFFLLQVSITAYYRDRLFRPLSNANGPRLKAKKTSPRWRRIPCYPQRRVQLPVQVPPPQHIPTRFPHCASCSRATFVSPCSTMRCCASATWRMTPLYPSSVYQRLIHLSVPLTAHNSDLTFLCRCTPHPSPSAGSD